MNEYIVFNEFWQKLIDKNILDTDPQYYYIDASNRYELTPFEIMLQNDRGGGFVDVGTRVLSDLSPVEQWGITLLIQGYLAPYSELREWHVETCVHLNMIEAFLNANSIPDAKIVPIPGSSTATVYYQMI